MSQYKLRVGVPRELEVEGQKLSREHFYDWAWVRLKGLSGIHEGTMLSEEAAKRGLETESWPLDAAEAPAERDWVGGLDRVTSELFFASLEDAHGALSELRALGEQLSISDIEEQVEVDWVARWRDSYKPVDIPPCWRILPSWVNEEKKPGQYSIRINPGAGFGTGTHETTQLCLRAIGAEFGTSGTGLSGKSMLDFGSGSGILAIAAALLGVRADAVEVDKLAIENARDNAQLNQVGVKIRFAQTLFAEPASYDLVVANILRPILLQFSRELCSRVAPGGTMILSGLIETDVPLIREAYEPLLKPRAVEVSELAEWRGIVFQTPR